jgi:FSR family fosmidomycin resistance protein-like MFS transporter
VNLLRNRNLLAVVSGHFMVDALNSVGAIVLTFLSVPLGLSNQQIGTLLTIYLLAGALSQPLFGWLSDRTGNRQVLLAAIGVGWMAFFYGVIALATSQSLLFTAFMLAALGSGLFHPVGTAAAAAAEPDRAATATSLYFFGGQIGLAVGPVLTGLLMGRLGVAGVLVVALLAIFPVLQLLAASKRISATVHKGTAESSPSMRLSAGRLLIAAFITLVIVRSSMQQIFSSFLPKLFSDRGWDPELYGAVVSVFMATAAVGNIITGSIADRYSMRHATVWPLLASVPVSLLVLTLEPVWAVFAAAALGGVLVGGQHSVLIVHAQRLLPVREGFAAGLILGFIFATGAIGTWLGGVLADSFGLQPVMMAATLLGIPAAALAWTLPGRQPAVIRPAAEVQPAAGD